MKPGINNFNSNQNSILVLLLMIAGRIQGFTVNTKCTNSNNINSVSKTLIPSLSNDIHSFAGCHHHHHRRRRRRDHYTKNRRIQELNAKFSDNNEEEDDDDDDDIDLSDRDWRAFRAQLVMDSSSSTDEANDDSNASSSSSSKSSPSSSAAEIITDATDLDGIGSLFDDQRKEAATPMSTENFTPLKPSQWAYDSGNIIEQGAVILGGVEQDYGFGLRQQYFHKAVILVLQHDDKFTKGIILNRPSDLILVDEKNDENHVEMRWRVWFGGDVQGLDALMPEVICMHTMPSGNERIDKVSETVMKGIKWTTFEDAKMLVRDGQAKTIDFWVFAGYAGKNSKYHDTKNAEFHTFSVFAVISILFNNDHVLFFVQY